MQLLLYQQSAYDALRRLWAGGRFPHALLIEGARGSGKRTLARYAAAMLLCRSPGERPCGTCLSCRKLESGNHPDLTVVDGSLRKAYAVDSVRDLRRGAWVAPNESERRVLLLTEVQNMSPASQNALLKILEEPPPHVCFVMTVTGRGALLDTVRSRAATIPMEEPEPGRREEILSRLVPETDPVLRREAAAAFETVGQALEALSDEETGELLRDTAELTDAVFSRDRYGVLRILARRDGDREELDRQLGLLRTSVIRRLVSGDGSCSALQCAKIVAIIEKAQARCAQNVGRPLLCAVLADELLEIV